MSALPQDIPTWLIKLLAALLGLGLVAVLGLLFRRLFRKFTDRLPLK